ncbi:MAG TPA: cupin domain-containing protein, partial [Polyangiaceae bacterium]|nr:cupin domain-containing protein [Polyangiaceae bacterium]
VLRVVERAGRPPATISAFGRAMRHAAGADEEDLPRAAASANQVRELLAAGATVAVYRVDGVDDSFARWVGDARARLGHAGRTTCSLWLSSRGEGMRPHFDAFSSLHVQLVGSKSWRVAGAPHVRAPRGAGVLLDDGTADVDATGFAPRYERVDRASFSEVTMRPGDVLFVPSGTWHETACEEGGVSASCSLELRHGSFRQVVTNYLGERFSGEAFWRSMPLAPASDEGAEARLDAFFARRIDEAIAALEALRDGRFGLKRAWAQLVADNGASDPRPPALPRAAPTLRPDDRLAAPPGKPLTYAFGEDPPGSPVLYLYQEGQVARLDDPTLSGFARRLVEAGEFVAGEACAWAPQGASDWEQVRELLGTLVESGMLLVRRGD